MGLKDWFSEARKYHAQVAVVLAENHEPRVCILREEFEGRETWAHKYHRKPLSQIDQVLREEVVRDILAIATTGEQYMGHQIPGRNSWGDEIIPKDFSGIVIFDVKRHSNNLEGNVGTSYKAIQKIPYHSSKQELIHRYYAS